MNRTDRLVALVMLLQSRRVITAAEMAAHFEVTERTVYRDLAALGEGGVPIVGEAGVGYSLMRGYQLPPVKFSSAEAMSLITGGMVAEQMTDMSVRGPLRSALAKLVAILPADQQAQAHALRSITAVSNRKPLTGAVPLSAIQAATMQRQVLHLHYDGAQRGAITQRDVEPLGLIYYLQQWHLIAWCRLRDEVRDFRVDRIVRCVPMPETASPRPGFDLHTFATRHHCSEGALKVDLRVHRLAKESILRAWGPAAVEHSQDGVWSVLRLQTPELDYLARWLVGFGDQISVLEPAELRQRIVSAAEAAMRHHQQAVETPTAPRPKKKRRSANHS